MWVRGIEHDQPVKRSLKTRSWERAETLIRLHAEAETQNPSDAALTLTPADQLLGLARDSLLKDLAARGIDEYSIRKFKQLLDKLGSYCTTHRLNLRRLQPRHITDFRSTWTWGPLTQVKYLERLRNFFRWCQQLGYLQTNPAQFIKSPRIKPKPTMPFTRIEMDRIIGACRTKRYRALVLLLRHSGLRITDAVGLRRDRIVNGKLFLYTQKTGTPVRLPLPPHALAALAQCPNVAKEYFFYRNEGLLRTASKTWRRQLAKLFKRAKVDHGFPHRFRDTFACELLEAGVPIEEVSVLLGHSSIAVTQKHYAPWVAGRQARLEELVRKSWESPKLGRVNKKSGAEAPPFMRQLALNAERPG
jgi:integrase/recombinase XerD